MAKHQVISCRTYARSKRDHLDNTKTVANGLLHARDTIYPTVVEPECQKNCCQVEMWRRCISNSDSYMAHPIFTTLDEDIIGGDQKAVTMDAFTQDPGNYLSGSPFTSHNNYFFIYAACHPRTLLWFGGWKLRMVFTMGRANIFVLLIVQLVAKLSHKNN